MTEFIGRIEVLSFIDSRDVKDPEAWINPWGDRVFYNHEDLTSWYETARPDIDDHSFAADILTPVVIYRFSAIKRTGEEEEVIASRRFQTRLSVEVSSL